MPSWLLRGQDRDGQSVPAGPPWRPPALARALEPGERPDRPAYVVVDELHEGIAGLVVSPWPHVDERGRLHFGGEARSRRLATPAVALEALLRERRVAVTPVPAGDAEEAVRARPLAIGDVFAAEVALPEADGADDPERPRDPQEILPGTIVDVTAFAMEAAKLQASAAAAGVADERLLDAVAAEQAEPAPGPAGTDGPDPTGGG